ncbi:MAG: hypothetical protein KatS3mg057_1982 [Herpetosiphonaceae bacterium]|nr:MAG: hypothetical protein KatS3mg057_1982 [Herpetosiphonaceae bacterium]
MKRIKPNEMGVWNSLIFITTDYAMIEEEDYDASLPILDHQHARDHPPALVSNMGLLALPEFCLC